MIRSGGADLYVEGAAAATGTAVRGFPGSAGVVEGSVRVLAEASESDQLRRARCW